MKKILSVWTITVCGYMFCGIASVQAQEDRRPPKIVHQIIRKAEKDSSLEISARIYDQSGIFEPKVYYRRFGQDNYRTAPMTKRAGLYRATIPASVVTQKIAYFIEAFDENGNGPARHGSPHTPHVIEKIIEQTTPKRTSAYPSDVLRSKDDTSRKTGKRSDSSKADEQEKPGSGTSSSALLHLPPSAEEKTATRPEGPDTTAPSPAPGAGCGADDAPIYCAWWFWTAIAAVVVSGGATGLFFALDSSGDNGASSLIRLDVTAPDPRP
jgi:hypothetical protein